MSNVPSTAIIAIMGIVAACVLAGFVFTAITSERRTGLAMERKLAEADVSNHAEDYMRYAGTTMDGSAVLSVIKIYKGDPVEVRVTHSGGGTYYYDLKSSDVDKKYERAKNKSVGGAEYISPASDFECSLEFNSNGSVKALVFTEK